MKTKRMPHAGEVGPLEQLLPIDAETIGETIRRALGMGAAPLDAEAMAEVEEVLSGHIGLLLPEVRKAAEQLPPSSAEAHRLRARLDCIQQQSQLQAHHALRVHVQVQLLARDCHWLLARHIGEVCR
ncbi:DUF6415 family natural product biosynthesis protein [Streptomyces sp. Pv4-95]|uniref:DUF6415 family natural product biosynthesis protein n=1 Tax=Streptomyces sp. Pv4-95 TaxID=3049543 RepID=UPI0038911A27